MKFIPVNKPLITKQDQISVARVVRSGWVSSSGKEIKEFEKKFSKLHKKKFGIATANGTAALEIAVKSLNLKKGSEVLIPNFTIISSILAVLKNNLTPKLIDADLNTWNMDLNDLKNKISKKTKLIIVTHIYSFPNDMDLIKKIIANKKIFIIEDAAEMIGQKYKNKICGSFGDISIFSFYANKHITTGEGGMILTNSKEINDKCLSFRNLCFGKKNRFNHEDIGWNYRMTNMQAALGLSQLKRLNLILKKKIQIGKWYHKYLKKNENFYIQPLKNKFSKNIFWVFGILLKKNFINKTKNFTEYLKKKKIETRPFFWSMHLQKILKINIKKKLFKNSEYLSKNGIYLPSGISLTRLEIKYVCDCVNIYFNKKPV
jgi:perosamine synthetase